MSWAASVRRPWRLDAALFRHLGEIASPPGVNSVQFLEGADVVTDGDPGLDDAGIGKQPRERPAEGREVQAGSAPQVPNRQAE